MEQLNEEQKKIPTILHSSRLLSEGWNANWNHFNPKRGKISERAYIKINVLRFTEFFEIQIIETVKAKVNPCTISIRRFTSMVHRR